MKIRKTILSILFVLSFSLNVLAQELTVAVAANMQFAFEELKNQFSQGTGIKINPVIGSSGKLTTQIEHGAPFDIFISADMKYPQVIFDKKWALTEPKIYAYGTLVLWTLKDLDLTQGLKILIQPTIQKIALANPQSAPYGTQAINAMKRSDIYSAVEKKLVYGESITQVNQFVTSGGGDIGFTAEATVMAEALKTKGRWIEVDDKLYEPIAQGVVVLKYTEERNLESAMKFYDYLFSPEARAILEKYGYRLP